MHQGSVLSPQRFAVVTDVDPNQEINGIPYELRYADDFSGILVELLKVIQSTRMC